MSSPTLDDLHKVRLVIEKGGTPELLASVNTGTSPLVTRRPDGSFFISKELFALVARTAKAAGPNKADAEFIYSKLSFNTPTRPARTTEVRPIASDSRDPVWIRHSVALQFATQSYGFATAKTMMGPLIERLSADGVIEVKESARGN